MGTKKPRFFGVFQEAQTGFEPVDTGVADHCLTTWLLRHIIKLENDSNGNRTRVTAVKGRCLNRLTMEPCHFFPALLSYTMLHLRR